MECKQVDRWFKLGRFRLPTLLLALLYCLLICPSLCLWVQDKPLAWVTPVRITACSPPRSLTLHFLSSSMSPIAPALQRGEFTATYDDSSFTSSATTQSCGTSGLTPSTTPTRTTHTHTPTSPAAPLVLPCTASSGSPTLSAPALSPRGANEVPIFSSSAHSPVMLPTTPRLMGAQGGP